jgi:phasin
LAGGRVGWLRTVRHGFKGTFPAAAALQDAVPRRHPDAIPANAKERTMNDEVRDRFEIPKEMRSVAEASLEQARKAFEKFVTTAQATADTIEERNATVRAGAKDISSKAIAYAEKNVQTSLDHAQSLLKAKDLPEVMRLHGEFVQGQMRTLAEQASEMGQIVGKAAMDAAKPKA